MSEESQVFKPHSEKQEQAIFSDLDITLCCTGLQWGKTTVGARWLQRIIWSEPDPKYNYIVTAPTYKIMNQSTLPEFLRVFEGFGKYNDQKGQFLLSHGATVYFRTGTDPDSVVGVTRVRAIWGDEAGKYGKYFWENIEGRAAFLNAPIMFTTTPYSMNWMFHELVKPVKAGARDDVLLIGASSNENPYFNKTTFEKRKKTMDPRKFRAMYEGQFERLQGLVYDCYNPDIHIQDGLSPEVFNSCKLYGGIDWGFTDPFVLLIMAITPSGDRFVISEYYKTGLGPEEMLDVVKSKMSIYPMKSIFCDPSQPGYIKYLNENAIPAVKANNDISYGVGVVYGDFKAERLKFIKDQCPYTLDEIEMYHYPEPEDLKPDQNAKPEKPVDQNNHGCDALRYVEVGTQNIFKVRRPRVSEEKKKREETPLDYVNRIKRHRPQTYEVWS